MSRRGTRCRAFTLIELLVVVMIIFMLSGMLFTVSKLASGRATRAKSLAIIERMRNAVTEFHAEYGMYPPVSSVTYEREQSDEAHQLRAMIDFLDLNNDPDNPEAFFPDIAARYNSTTWPTDARFGGENLGYRYGLVSYLWPRAQGGQPHFYDKDSTRDEHSKDGWASYLEDVPLGGGASAHASPAGLGTRLPYTNEVHVVRDGWGNILKYSSPPPHSSFKLWSVGPDGRDGTADDVGNDSFNQ